MCFKVIFSTKMSDINEKKREAQSPLSGDEDDLKRCIIDDGVPVLATLDEIAEDE